VQRVQAVARRALVMKDVEQKRAVQRVQAVARRALVMKDVEQKRAALQVVCRVGEDAAVVRRARAADVVRTLCTRVLLAAVCRVGEDAAVVRRAWAAGVIRTLCRRFLLAIVCIVGLVVVAVAVGEIAYFVVQEPLLVGEACLASVVEYVRWYEEVRGSCLAWAELVWRLFSAVCLGTHECSARDEETHECLASDEEILVLEWFNTCRAFLRLDLLRYARKVGHAGAAAQAVAHGARVSWATTGAGVFGGCALALCVAASFMDAEHLGGLALTALVAVKRHVPIPVWVWAYNTYETLSTLRPWT